MKVLVIVLGSIAGLILLSVVALAILVPVLGKKFITDSNDPHAVHTTTSKIADFVVPPGFKIGNALDLGITQTAIIQPVDRSKYSLMLQLTAQHLPGGARDSVQDKTLLDQMASSVTFAEKLRGCDLKPGPGETIAADGKNVSVQKLSCPRDGVPLTLELAIVHAKASTVQLVATDVRAPVDHAALVSFVRSLK